MDVAVHVGMKALIKLGVLGLVGIGATIVIKQLRARARRPSVAGSMVVGEIDELEISSGIMDTTAQPLSQVAGEGYDPDVIPSVHTEINDLLENLPSRTR
ncbi:MAG: hypothetical protein JWO36_6120 [Myxococcales bacterium]|nr:hypothetical protein [Myxococcales bacterium]